MNRLSHIFLLLLLSLPLPLAAATLDELPQDTIPTDTIPTDTIPTDTIPQDSTFLTLVIDTVKSGDQLVFERNGAVLDEQTPKSGALLTTTSFVTTNLTGRESYVWTVIKGPDGLYIGSRNGFYINNPSGTNLSLDYDAVSTPWTFVFAEDSTATIYTADKKRFIGETAPYSRLYMCYSKIYLSAYDHTFHIYRIDRPLPPEPEPTGIDKIFESSNLQIIKLLKDGHLLIEKAGIKYNILGQTIR